MAKRAREASNGQLFNARTFIVEGDGRFPIDMLRYDACWPCEERDSHAIHASVDDHDHPRRAILLKTRWPSAPTVGRWQSHGWIVTVIDGQPIDPRITNLSYHRIKDAA